MDLEDQSKVEQELQEYLKEAPKSMIIAAQELKDKGWTAERILELFKNF